VRPRSSSRVIRTNLAARGRETKGDVARLLRTGPGWVRSEADANAIRRGNARWPAWPSAAAG
jgi:hypothetical protein